MKNTMRLFLAVLLSLGFAITSFATIEGTVHDLSTTNGGFTNDQICVYCHTPHHAKTAPADYNPLWNMAVPTSALYTSYSSSTFMFDSATGTNTTIADPLVGPSRLCMSCHDGTIGVDNAINPTSVTYIDVFTGDTSGLLDTDLSNDHPIGFDYDDAQALDSELFASSAPYTATGSIADYLFGGVMTCASCHDVHNATPAGGPTGKFLLVTNGQSNLCLSCHDK